MGYKDAGRIHVKPTEALNSQELMPPSAGGMNSSRAVGKRRLLLHTQELWSIVEKQRMGSTVEGSQRNQRPEHTLLPYPLLLLPPQAKLN